MEILENMTIEEEWLAQIRAAKTKENYLRGWNAFKSFLNKTPEEILELRKKEGKRFITRVVLFFEAQKDKGFSENTARTFVIPVQSFLSYFDLPIEIKDKLPKLHMKLETYRLKLEDLQKIFRLGDLETKAWISLSRDVPARISDLLRIAPDKIEEEEFLIKSQKENVVGKCYVSDQTRELFRLKPKLPISSKGIDKLLKRACDIAQVPRINQHLIRKLWITTAINLGIQDTIIRILTFKTVPEDILTYFLDREDLRESWEKVVNILPLELKANGRITNMQESIDLVFKVLRHLVEEEMQEQHIRVLYERQKEPTDRDILETFLRALELRRAKNIQV